MGSCSESKADFRKEEEMSKVNSKYSSLKKCYWSGKGDLDSLRNAIRDLPGDSLKTEMIFDFSSYYYKQKDSAEFRYWNTYSFFDTSSQKDSSRLAEAHWDLANFYADYEIVDSSFYHFNTASQIYSNLGDDLRRGKMLLNIGILQKNIKDYTGSEISTTKAIELLKPKESMRDLYIGYNNLGILYNQLEEYQEALKYHSKAAEAAQSLANPVLQASTLNNIGVVYENMGKYGKAVLHFEESLGIDSIYFQNPRLYAMMIDNLAYSRFKGGDNNVLNLFDSALAIRDSIGHQSGVVINKIHLGEFYLNIGDTIGGTAYVEEAKLLASEINNHRDWLASLLILSKIKTAEAGTLLNEYIKLNDSLQKNERTVRNKFARIRFETDEFIAENQQLTEQRKWLIGGSASGFVLSLLTIIIFRQKARNKELKNERDQQKANEDIYKLLLDQEKKIEEGKHKEKERISKELHDGVLSEMYGIRFLLNNLNTKDDLASIDARQKYLERLRIVEEEIRFISRDLQKTGFFEEVGFLKLLKNLIIDQEKQIGFLPVLNNDPNIEWESIDYKVKMNLYRIIQETLLNIKKYAQANQTAIDFGSEYNDLLLTIRDNGKGFDINKISRGIGIKNMKLRVKDLRGHLNIISNDSGTIIKIKIPIGNG